jgi:hypothetical protein
MLHADTTCGADILRVYACMLQVRARTAAETFARDSFENLLFSIARFREITGSYPKQITVVGYDFKKQR